MVTAFLIYNYYNKRWCSTSVITCARQTHGWSGSADGSSGPSADSFPSTETFTGITLVDVKHGKKGLMDNLLKNVTQRPMNFAETGDITRDSCLKMTSQWRPKNTLRKLPKSECTITLDYWLYRTKTRWKTNSHPKMFAHWLTLSKNTTVNLEHSTTTTHKTFTPLSLKLSARLSSLLVLAPDVECTLTDAISFILI